VGHFDFASDSMDTCIAIRTMTFKDGVAYLQAGGGIVFDSVEEDEYVETLNKLGANVKCLEQAEGEFVEVPFRSSRVFLTARFRSQYITLRWRTRSRRASRIGKRLLAAEE
jgi:hypothetical protein